MTQVLGDVGVLSPVQGSHARSWRGTRREVQEIQAEAHRCWLANWSSRDLLRYTGAFTHLPDPWSRTSDAPIS